MKTPWIFRFLLAAAAVMFACPIFAAPPRPEATNQMRVAATETMKQGNFKDALEQFQKLLLDPQDEPRLVGNDLNNAVMCLLRLNRMNETDALLENAVKVHKDNWRLLTAAARQYMNLPHQGFIIAGRFERGHHRGGGKIVNSIERDRVRALQLMVQAMPLAIKDDNHAEAGQFLLELAGMLLNNRGYGEAWRLQTLTDLAVLPDYDEGWGRYGQSRGAPVDAEGRPIYYTVPKTFETAENDGQRWRWCLQQAAEMDAGLLGGVRMQLAEFCQSQFGVETLAEWGWRIGRMESDDTKEDDSGTYALHTLKDSETIARLATGIKRFELPDEFNYLKIYQQVADDARTGLGPQALEQLANCFENRRQYEKAADYWRRLLKDYPNEHPNRRQGWQQRLDQITGNWGRFEPSRTQPAGRGAGLDYRFRNGRQVEFTAREIKVQQLLDDVNAFLKSRPTELKWDKVNIENLGHRLLQADQEKYLGREVARWRMSLEPREKHFDKRVAVTTPLQQPGAYWIEAKMADGNTSYIVLWIDDTAIVKKPLEGKSYYFVADAVTGKPIPKANVEFFGWRPEYRNQPRRHDVITKQFAEYTDADGQVTLDAKSQPDNMQWLVIARTKQGRFAYLGFSNVWFGQRHDAEYNETKVYAITDRPVYRPDQKVQFKFWVRHAKYDMGETSDFAEKDFVIELNDPRGEKIAEWPKKADAYGGIEGEYALPADASLGQYYLAVKPAREANPLGGGSFRVEAYKKPEYEVTVEAPEKPVMLGEKITATIKAKYYFGSPVTKAKVKYKVERTDRSERWYPIGPWTGSTAAATGGSAATILGIPAGRAGVALGPRPFGGRNGTIRPNWSPSRRSRSARTAR
jgi:tetratricopeptide (TPR) repeat protein